MNGSGDINIFDTIQVRNQQFTSLPEGEPSGVTAFPAPAPAPGSISPTAVPSSSLSKTSPAPLALRSVTTSQRAPLQLGSTLDPRLVSEVFRLFDTTTPDSSWLPRRALLGRKLAR
jgi:hypothetical protein